jgi:hypothetical protein
LIVDELRDAGPVFFFFSFYSILWCCDAFNHPWGDLAMFGYRPVMKVEIY